MNNNIRFDLSDYLIHFFRDIDTESDNAMPMPDHLGWHSLAEDTLYPATFLLRAAIRNGRLWATFLTTWAAPSTGSTSESGAGLAAARLLPAMASTRSAAGTRCQVWTSAARA